MHPRSRAAASSGRSTAAHRPARRATGRRRHVQGRDRLQRDVPPDQADPRGSVAWLPAGTGSPTGWPNSFTSGTRSPYGHRLIAMQRARAWHAVTAAVAIGALVLVLALVLQSHRVLDETSQPGLGVRLGRLVSYFTIQSNILVAVTAAQLARDPARDGSSARPAGRGHGGHHRHRRRALLPAAAVARARWRRLRVRQTAAHGGAGARGRRLGGLRPPPADPRGDILLALCWPVAWLAWTLVSAACPAGTRIPSSTTASRRASQAWCSPASGSRCPSWPCSGWPGSTTAALASLRDPRAP